MSRRSWQVATMLPATLTMGLTAGFFYAWHVSVMPGLARLDDRTFVGAFQALDRAIMTSPLLMLTFTAALVFTSLAAVLYRREDNRAPLPWVAVAFGLCLATVVITVAVHEPLNAVIRSAGDPDLITNLAAILDAFQQARWIAWNIVRTIATTAAFGCLAWALVLHGRATADAADLEAPRSAQTAPRPPSGATP
jgi:uncharacterized membrane protein